MPELTSEQEREILLECAIHGIPMEWVEDVMAWICQYGCIEKPCETIRKMNIPGSHVRHI